MDGRHKNISDVFDKNVNTLGEINLIIFLSWIDWIGHLCEECILGA